jgi:hypothetical protein
MLLTLVFCHAGNLGEEFDEVWQVIAEELDSNDEVLASVVLLELGAEEF